MQPSTARSSGSSGQLDEANGTRSCDHDLGHGDLEQDGGGWVRSLAVATFDVGTGHTLEQVTGAGNAPICFYHINLRVTTDRTICAALGSDTIDLPNCFFLVLYAYKVQ